MTIIWHRPNETYEKIQKLGDINPPRIESVLPSRTCGRQRTSYWATASEDHGVGWCPYHWPSAGSPASCRPCRWHGQSSIETCSHFWKRIHLLSRCLGYRFITPWLLGHTWLCSGWTPDRFWGSNVVLEIKPRSCKEAPYLLYITLALVRVFFKVQAMKTGTSNNCWTTPLTPRG